MLGTRDQDPFLSFPSDRDADNPHRPTPHWVRYAYDRVRVGTIQPGGQSAADFLGLAGLRRPATSASDLDRPPIGLTAQT
ncbi:MAG: hypothetical protein ACXVA6_20165 [Isosphaeraceae bacterium]